MDSSDLIVLSNNSEAVVAFSAVISAVATVVLAGLTMLLFLENRALRKAGNSPRVVAHFEVHPDGTGALNLALSNVGTGPAANVMFTMIGEQEEFSNYDLLVDASANRPAISLIGQQDKLSFLFAVGYKLFTPKNSGDDKVSRPMKPFSVNVQWTTVDGKRKFSETYELNVAQFDGLRGLMAKPPALRVVDALESIDRRILKLLRTNESASTLLDTTEIKESSRANISTGTRQRSGD